MDPRQRPLTTSGVLISCFDDNNDNNDNNNDIIIISNEIANSTSTSNTSTSTSNTSSTSNTRQQQSTHTDNEKTSLLAAALQQQQMNNSNHNHNNNNNNNNINATSTLGSVGVGGGVCVVGVCVVGGGGGQHTTPTPSPTPSPSTRSSPKNNFSYNNNNHNNNNSNNNSPLRYNYNYNTNYNYNSCNYDDDDNDDGDDDDGSLFVAHRIRNKMNNKLQVLVIVSSILALLALGGFAGVTTSTILLSNDDDDDDDNYNYNYNFKPQTTTKGATDDDNDDHDNDDDDDHYYVKRSPKSIFRYNDDDKDDDNDNDNNDDDYTYLDKEGYSLYPPKKTKPKTNSKTKSKSTTTTTNSKYKKVQYFGFQIYTGGAPAFLYNTNTNTNNTTNTTTTNTIKNPECSKHTYGQIPDDDGSGTGSMNIQCYIGHINPMKDVEYRLQIMKDSLEKAYTESLLDNDILKIFVAPEFYFRGINGAYNFDNNNDNDNDNNPNNRALDKIFGYNHTSDENSDANKNDKEVCTEGPVCAILKGLQDLVEDARFKDWFFLFGTVIASQKLPIISNNTDTDTDTNTNHNNSSNPNYEYLYYNFAPVYKGFDPKDEMKFLSSSKKKKHKKKKKNKKKNKHHYALGKRFLLPKRYVSTSDFLTPSRDVDWMNRGNEWEELFSAESQQDKKLDLDKDGGNWVTDNGYDADGVGVATTNVAETDYNTDTVVGNPKTKHYDDDWFTSYKKELYDKAGYTMIEYDWLMMDGLSMSLEVCLDHQLRSALDTYLGDIITGRTTKIPSSSDNEYGNNGITYVSIPTYQAQISLVSSAGMSPATDSLALCQNGIIFVQDGISNKTSRRYIDNESMDICGPQTALQYEGGTIGVRRRSLLTKTDVRFEYELLSSSRSSSINNNPTTETTTEKMSSSSSSSSSLFTASSSSSTSSTSEETAYEYKVPVYENNDSWKSHLNGIFSTQVYEPHLVIYGPIDIATV